MKKILVIAVIASLSASNVFADRVGTGFGVNEAIQAQCSILATEEAQIACANQVIAAYQAASQH
jgi:hypothetical protein